MSQKAINAFKKLDNDDFEILEAIERGIRAYEHVPIKIISLISGFPEGYRSDWNAHRCRKGI